MPRQVPWLTNGALRLIREALGWDQRELAAAVEVSPDAISDYENCRLAHPLERARLEELVAAMGAPPAAIDVALGALEWIRSLAGAGTREDGLELPRELREVLAQAAARIGRMASQSLTEDGRNVLLDTARAQAAAVWEALRRQPDTTRQLLLDNMPGYATWATVERLAHESERAAARNVAEALTLGALAVSAADLVPGPPALQAAAREYAWRYLSNARRVKGLHAEAEVALTRAKREEPLACQLAMSPFSRARMLDLEASLRREQRRFEEALRLQDEALALAHPSELGLLWLNRAAVLEQSGNATAAISALQEALAHLDETSEPRHHLVACFNLAASLLDLGRAAEAVALLPKAREMAEERRDTIDVVRVQWLEGRAAAALGDPATAASSLEQVWQEFKGWEMHYDAALSALNLAECYLAGGRHAETRALARQAAGVFGKLEIKREEFKAVRLFLAAAELKRATVEQARLAYGALAAYRAQRGFSLAAPGR